MKNYGKETLEDGCKEEVSQEPSGQDTSEAQGWNKVQVLGAIIYTWWQEGEGTLEKDFQEVIQTKGTKEEKVE